MPNSSGFLPSNMPPTGTVKVTSRPPAVSVQGPGGFKFPNSRKVDGGRREQDLVTRDREPHSLEVEQEEGHNNIAVKVRLH